MPVGMKSIFAGAFAVTLMWGGAMSAQSVDELLAAGDREYAARRAPAALVHYERALKTDPDNYSALWRTSRTIIDISEFDTNAERRKAAFTRAGELAREAIAAEPKRAEGHFHLSRALGRQALSVSARQRTQYALDVRQTALDALACDADHPGALHVLGRWHAEVMRLNGITRMIAKTFMGGKVFGEASWKEAIRLLERANAIEPDRTVHQVALGQVYRDAGQKAKARVMFEAALQSPLYDINDEEYKAEAARELRDLGN